jgi:HlyD family secretion protein
MEHKKKRKWWLWLLLLVIIASGVVYGRQLMLQRQAEAVGLDPDQIVEAFMGDLSTSVSATGTVKPMSEASLALEVPGIVDKVAVRVGDEVKAGDLLVQTEADNLSAAVASAEQALIIQQASLDQLNVKAWEEDVAAAEAAVTSAQAQLDDLLAGPSEEEIAAAEADLQAMQSSVDAASAQLAQTSSGATEAEIAAAEANLASAQSQYRSAVIAYDKAVQEKKGKESAQDSLTIATRQVEAAQARLDVLLEGPTQDVVGAAQANLAAAVAQRDAAQTKLDMLLREPSQSQKAALESQIAQAEAALETLLEGPSAQTIVMAEAQVEQARISLEEAQELLSKTMLVAPFDGIITHVYVAVGEYASGAAVDLMDTNSIEVVLDVDEVDIGALAVGDPAIITLEAWPDEEIETMIRSIAPASNLSPGDAIVSYQVYLAMKQPDLPVLTGMTANAELITAQLEDVLLVPNRSISIDRDSGIYYVNIIRGKSVEQAEISIGLRDSQYTRVTHGLEAGDKVVVGTYQTNSLRESGMFMRGSN